MMQRNGWLAMTMLGAALAAQAAGQPVPRLTVVIAVDQMRADYLERFRPYFGPDGFNRLLTRGAWFQDCHYQHAVTKTAPGHATILSGVHANVHGIIGNEWLDPETFLQGNALEDPSSPLVGVPSQAGRSPGGVLEAKAGRSPRNFLATTVGDRLKARYGKAAKVFGIADKDRSAILLAGARADGAYWTEQGRVVTSTYYRTDLPAWVEDFNREEFPARQFGRSWERQLDAAIYDRVQGPDDAPGELVEDGLAATFPKRVDGEKTSAEGSYFDAFDHTPWDNDWIARAAARLVAAEQLGTDEVPDLLGVGFSQPDKCGHAYGPDSHEVMDTFVCLDRTLAGLFRFLDEQVGAGNYLVVLTADHAVAPLPETTQRLRGADKASRLKGPDIDTVVADALTTEFGILPEPLYWAVRDGSGYRLNRAALAAKNLSSATAQEKLAAILATHPQIAAVYTRETLTGSDALDRFGKMSRLSFHSARSPDVVYIPREWVVERSPGGTTHGTPWPYDTHVPLLWAGPGIEAQVRPETVHVSDVAPTLAAILGVELPPEAKGKRLF